MSHTKKERNEALMRLRDTGMSFGKIAKALGIDKTRAVHIYYREKKKLSPQEDLPK